MPFSFSMSLMFIFMPPGIMMSPGFWSALQAPEPLRLDRRRGVARHARRTALAVRGRLHGIGGIEVAGDLGMRGDRHAGDAADGIGDIAGRGLLDVLLRADFLGHGENDELISLSVVSSVQCCMVMSGIGEPDCNIFISHRPALRTGSSTAPARRAGSSTASRQAPERNETSCRVMLALPAMLSVGSG